jgi:hypothetical protein
MLLFRLLPAAAAASIVLMPASVFAEAQCCQPKPPIRPIDKTCLPAGRPKKLALYRSDLQAKYQEIAHIDSFISDNNCSDTVRAQLKDLQQKGTVIGADAMIRVRLLANKVTGYQENPDTPFFSLKQGTANDYFYRATAIKYLEPPPAEPKELTVNLDTTPLPEKTKIKSTDPLNAGKLFGSKKSNQPRDVTVPEVINTTPGSF